MGSAALIAVMKTVVNDTALAFLLFAEDWDNSVSLRFRHWADDSLQQQAASWRRDQTVCCSCRAYASRCEASATQRKPTVPALSYPASNRRYLLWVRSSRQCLKYHPLPDGR